MSVADETAMSMTPHGGSADFDVERVRRDFPVLGQTVNGKPLAYLDNAATTQKPEAVIDAVTRYYRQDNANIHRGVHQLSMRATDAYERARTRVQRFIGAEGTDEIIFVRGATEGINLVAQAFGRANIRPGDEIVITAMEHHSNIVPWQILCEQTGAKLRVAPISDDGEVIRDAYAELLGERTRIVAMVHVSNALGTVNPVVEMTRLAHEHGAVVLIDGAQSVPHLRIDVRELGCDFFVFSGHKVFGPTGVGVLYGRRELLQAMPPYQGGGDMIESVSFEKTTYNQLPYKFEAGTPNIAGVIGLGAAVDYVYQIGLDAIAAHEARLLDYGTDRLTAIPEVRLIGTARDKASVLSFVVEGIHPHDVGTILDQQGVAVRTGHHCAQPVMQRFGVPATVRASLAFYNTPAELDALADGVRRVLDVFD